MDARSYYHQAHNIPQGTSCTPHVEDSGPAGRPCFRRGTLRDRPDVVCSYPSVSGTLDFWALADIDGSVCVGEDVDENMSSFDGDTKTWRCYQEMQAAYATLRTGEFLTYRAYPPTIRCSRIAFVGGLGYEAGRTALPEAEHPGQDAPSPSAESFLGWYGFDRAHKNGGIIDMDIEEGWGRPVFDFTPLAGHADQSWAYAPATPSRNLDVSPERGTTTIASNSWQYIDSDGVAHNSGLPPDDVDIDNWWLLAMVGGFPRPGQNTVTPLYWNPTKTASLTFFGEPGSANLTLELYQTILRRIYASHCMTADIDEDFAGIPFPPGFLLDARIIADTYECDCTQKLMEAAGVSTSKIFSHNTRGRAPFQKIYMGTHFSVLYRCPFPIWRRAAA